MGDGGRALLALMLIAYFGLDIHKFRVQQTVLRPLMPSPPLHIDILRASSLQSVSEQQDSRQTCAGPAAYPLTLIIP